MAGRVLAVVLAAAVVNGCGDSTIRVYTVPNEEPWVLPAGWKEQTAGGMRAARFSAPSTSGSDLDISIIPIRGFGGSHADIINIWRQQMQLEPVSGEAEAARLAEKVKLGPNEGELYDMTSSTNMLDGQKARTMVAVLRKDGTTWFVKMTGDEPAVERQKSNYLAFLKSVNVSSIAPPKSDMASAGPGGEAHGPGDGHDHGEEGAPTRPDWQVPSGWVEQPRPQMLNAKFVVAGEGGSKADINVTVLQGDGGGLLANINRWRQQQLGLGAWKDPDVEKNVTNFDGANGKAMLVDFKGTDVRTRRPARLIGAIVPVAGQTWFYKLMGDESVVERERDSFIKFVSSAKHPNG
jgi:hypothetical protein